MLSQIFNSVSLPSSLRSSSDNLSLHTWFTSLSLSAFPFLSQSQILKLIPLLETMRLEGDSGKDIEGGVELVFVCRGSVVVEKGNKEKDKGKQSGKLKANVKEKGKKQTGREKEREIIQEGGWTTSKRFSSTSILISSLSLSLIILLPSIQSKPLLSRSLHCHLLLLSTIIQRQSLFSPLDSDTLLSLASSSYLLTLPYNTPLYSQHDQPLHAYILLQGTVVIYKDGIEVALLNPEQVFGDEEILEGREGRGYRAVVRSERVRVLRMEGKRVREVREVLGVLGREKEVERYLEGKRRYRDRIGESGKKWRGEKNNKETGRKEEMPYFRITTKKFKNIERENEEEQIKTNEKVLPLRLSTSRRGSLANIIRKEIMTTVTPSVKYGEQELGTMRRRILMLPGISK